VSLGFIPSDACVLVVQAAMVAAPRRLGSEDRLGRLAARLQSRWWALVPVGSIVVVIFAIQAASGVADGLTWLALIAIPILAAVAFGWAVRGARWWLGMIGAPLLALAWLSPATLWGQGAATLLTAFSCVTLGVLLASVCPPSWLKVGIVLMALGDSYLVLTDLLQAPNNELVAASPGAGLPQLQGITFGDVLLGYGDVFVAAVLGGVLARQGRSQWPMALLTLVVAGLFDLLFFVLDELPATVPVALAMIVGEGWLWARRRRRRGSDVGDGAGADARPDARPEARAQWGPSPPVAAGGRDSSASDVIARTPRAASSSTSVASSAERE
jgi:hypothetical protein